MAKQVKAAGRRKSQTDFKRLDRMTDRDVRKAVRSDPDAAPLGLDWSKGHLEIPEKPKKEAISIRLDADVLEFLRGEGAGYQARINAILRSYVGARRKARPSKRK